MRTLEEFEGQEWRCYHFGNFYLSSIQQGIQAAHAQMELFNKYTPNLGNMNEVDDVPQIDMLFTWSTEHKTMICLNGGMNIDLINIHDILATDRNPYPWSRFLEHGDALNGLLTNLAIVLPEFIFCTAEKIRSRKYYLEGNVVKEPPVQPMTEDGAMLAVHLEPITVCKLTDFEVQLVDVLNQCGLAR